MTVPDDRVARHWSMGKRSSLIYDFTIKREWFYAALSRVVWGADVRPMYREIAHLEELPPGTRVLDVPCGSGVAFRGLTPDVASHFVAADVSSFMLQRARGEEARRGLNGITFVETPVEHMPFDDSAFDLCLSYQGLHCFPDPAAALVEMARVIRPGGRLQGTVVVTGGSALSAMAIKMFRRTDQFGTVGSADDIRQWLSDAGFSAIQLGHEGAYVFFHAELPA
jgi:ubiquinone/menaquinone biosynthesis C-methylase UbiE